mgnify:CR=1 FL=1
MSTFDNALSSRPRSHANRRDLAQSHYESVALRSLDWVGDACFSISVIVVPLTSAVIRDTGVAIFIACSLLMGLTWAVRQIIEPKSCTRFSGAEVIVLASVALVSVQLLKLPHGILTVLSPFLSKHLQYWQVATGEATTWQTISLTPTLTKSGLVLLITYVVFFLAARQRINSRYEVDRIMKLLAISAATMAAIGLTQVLLGVDEFLGVFEHHSRSAKWPAKGAFTNQNHFAHFLSLGLGPLIFWWFSYERSGVPAARHSTGFGRSLQGGKSESSNQKMLVAGLIAVVALAGLASTSRGGVLCLLISATVALLAFGVNSMRIAKLAIPVCIFVVIGTLELGTASLQTKWQSIVNSSSASDLSSGRMMLWHSLAEAIPNFWRMGSGLGSHAEVYPMWLDQEFNVRFSHAECGYLQILLELGVPGLMLLVCGITYCFLAIKRSLSSGVAGKDRARILILGAGILVSCLHSFVDFVWYIPGCLIPTIVTAVCLLCATEKPDSATHNSTGSKTVNAVRWPTVFAWLVVILILPIGELSAGPAIRVARTERNWLESRNKSILPDEQIQHLQTCVRINPNDSRAYAKLATAYLDRFQRLQSESGNAITITELRGIVRSSEFTSNREVAEWLVRAFGKCSSDLYRANLAARNALLRQPMRGEAYVVLAQVGFLTGNSEHDEEQLIQQAMEVRPYESYIHYIRGLSMAANGMIDQSLESFSRAYALDKDLSQTIVQGLSPYLTPETFIETIRPDSVGLWHLFKAYESQGRLKEQQEVAQWYSSHIDDYMSLENKQNKEFWRRCEVIYSFSGSSQQAANCLRMMIELSPNDFNLKKKLGLALLNLGEIQEALGELEWCQMRAPEDIEVKAALQKIHADVRVGGTR